MIQLLRRIQLFSHSSITVSATIGAQNHTYSSNIFSTISGVIDSIGSSSAKVRGFGLSEDDMVDCSLKNPGGMLDSRKLVSKSSSFRRFLSLFNPSHIAHIPQAIASHVPYWPRIDSTFSRAGRVMFSTFVPTLR